MPDDTKTTTDPSGPPRSARHLVAPLGVAAAISGAVFLATQEITLDPNTSLFGQSATKTFDVKAWISTGVLALALFQLYSATWIYGRLPGRKPSWLGTAHRASGVGAIVLSLPVAYHCLFAYGFRNLDHRTLVHSLAGCFFYGAFAAKVMIVRSRRLPGWTLPVAGGVMVTLVVVLWYSAALWDFNNFSVPGLSPATSSAAPSSPYGSTAPGGAGAKPGGAGAPAAGAVSVAYRNIAISPSSVTVKAGQSITWTNFDPTTHNVVVTGGPATFTSPSFNQGGHYTFKAVKAGVYQYLCTFHPSQMKGTITVTR